jgi:hypothetical protein
MHQVLHTWTRNPRTDVTENLDIVNGDELDEVGHVSGMVRSLLRKMAYVDGDTFATEAARATDTVDVVLTISSWQ